MSNIQSLQEFLRSQGIFERFGLTRIGIFGSYARGEKYNDIDLLIEDDIDFEKREELKHLLEEKLHTKIDLVIKKYAEPIILKRAMKDMQYATRY
jgi:predicted nucleotidyltransferase